MGKKDGDLEGKPFDGKLDEIVGRAIPERWLATALEGTAAGVLFYFVLTIIGFARSPEEAAQAERRGAEEALAEEVKSHSETKSALEEVRAAKEAAEVKIEEAELDAERAKGKVDLVEADRDKFRTELDQLREQLGTERGAKDAAERQHKAFADAAGREKVKIAAERDAAQKDAAALRERVAKLEGEQAELRKQHDELGAAKAEDEKIADRARAAFDKIAEAVSGIEDPKEKIAAIERMREESKAELEGTPHMDRLDEMVAREGRTIEDQEAAAEKEAKREAKDIFSEMNRKLKMSPEYEDAMEIMRQAKEKVIGTDFEVTIHLMITKLETKHKDEAASAAYKEVLKQVGSSPNAYEENLRALEAALEQVKDTRYAAKLEGMVEKRRKTIKDDIARAARDEVNARIKSNPDDYDGNIAAAEAALPKTEGTNCEAPLRKRLDGMKEQRLDKIGRKAYDAALARLKESPREYAGNVAALKGLKADAEGSRWEAEIGKLLTKQEARLARER